MDTRERTDTKELMTRLAGRRWRKEDARRAVREWRRSGTSARAFARKWAMNPQRLLWWQKQLDDLEGASPVPLAFIPAVMTTAVASRATPVARTTVRLPAGVVIEMMDTTAVSARWVATLARELAKSS